MSDLMMWQYCYDPNDINKAIDKRDENWKGLISTEQIISITYDTSNSCYVVFWRCNQKECSDSEKPNSSDSISRQAAIDEIGEWIKAFLENGHKESAADVRLIQDGIIQLPSAQPDESKYEYHYDHTDCIWYRPEARNRCPVTCAQYRDGWNDAMNYIFREGKGYRPYRRDKQYER